MRYLLPLSLWGTWAAGERKDKTNGKLLQHRQKIVILHVIFPFCFETKKQFHNHCPLKSLSSLSFVLIRPLTNTKPTSCTLTAINSRLRVCLQMQIHNISPFCQLPVSSFALTLPLQLLFSFLSFISTLSQSTNIPPSLLSSFLFLKKLIFPIYFPCLNSLSSSLSMTHRLILLLPSSPHFHPSFTLYIWKASADAWVLPPALSLYLPSLPSLFSSIQTHYWNTPACSPSLPQL